MMASKRMGLALLWSVAGLVLAVGIALAFFRQSLFPARPSAPARTLPTETVAAPGKGSPAVLPVTPEVSKSPPESSAGRLTRSQVVAWDGLSVEPMTSELRTDLMVRPVVERLDQDLLVAVKDLKDTSGLFPVSSDRVVFVPVSQREATFRDPYSARLAGDAVRVEIAVEPVVLGAWAARAVLASALSESILLRAAPRYAEAPAWFRHGVALYLSHFGSTLADRTILQSPLPPQQLVRPLAEAGDLAWADGYWALKALSARGGDEAVKEWVQKVFEGHAWDEALKIATGETAEIFERGYQSWALASLRERCENRQEIVDAVALLRLQKSTEAIPPLEAFAKNRPLDLYAGNAAYYLNYARFRDGRYREAINGFTDLLVNAPATTTWQGKAHYFLGRSYQLAGYRPLAIKEYMLAAIDPDSVLLVKLAKEHQAEVEK